MVYKNIHTGIFRRRPNRFIAEVEIGGALEICHVKNTGRCAELLIPGVKVFVNRAENEKRSTRYDLISVWKGNRLINMDAQAPNRAFEEFLRKERFIGGLTYIKPEMKYGSSRFDFYAEAGERKVFIEVKGVTLEDSGIAMFPDAPTERGVKHLKELAKCAADGFDAYVIFIIQMRGVSYFTPNHAMHPAFGEALAAAKNAGVMVAAYDSVITADSVTVNEPVPVRL